MCQSWCRCMSILEEILAYKAREVEERKSLFPTKLLERSAYFETPCVSLTRYLRRTDRVGIIAEIKRRSPSKGVINQHISVEQLSLGYMQAGASALSVLTDTKFFGGTSEDLTTARRFNYCPILRKDFIVDEYQVVEAKSIGADVVLLIAAALSPARISALAAIAHGIGLEVLLEVHSASELESCSGCTVDLIGVNNRNLSDFTLDINRSLELAKLIPESVVKVSESGISDSQIIRNLKSVGYQGFLVGEAFMRHAYPEQACRALVEGVESRALAASSLGS